MESYDSDDEDVEAKPRSLEINIDATTLALQRLKQLIGVLWTPSSAATEDVQAKIKGAMKTLQQIAPRDPFEQMLSMQMVACHDAVLECMRRAALENQTFEGRDQCLRHGAKMMMTYTKLLETLNKHRGKGHQKVTVEHVNVEPGGQAIVGHVDTGSTAGRSTQATLRALDEKHPVPMQGDYAETPSKAR
ncbi:MAG: hypothetical protein AAGJ74_13715 [Pseudomonadota bacterium]